MTHREDLSRRVGMQVTCALSIVCTAAHYIQMHAHSQNVLRAEYCRAEAK